MTRSEKEHRNLSECIDWVAGELLRMEFITLEIQGDTEDEKVTSLVQDMLDEGVALTVSTLRVSSQRRPDLARGQEAIQVHRATATLPCSED